MSNTRGRQTKSKPDAQRRGRGERFPVLTRKTFAEWATYLSPLGEIVLEIKLRGATVPLRIALDPDDFYELTEDVRLCYDQLNGLT